MMGLAVIRRRARRLEVCLACLNVDREVRRMRVAPGCTLRYATLIRPCNVISIFGLRVNLNG
jgi:hypothetical protein